MNSAQVLFLLIVFAVVVGLAWLGVQLFAPGTLRARLSRPGGRTGDSSPDARGWTKRMTHAMRPLSKLSMPDEGWEKSPLRMRFMNAGWRTSHAPTLYVLHRQRDIFETIPDALDLLTVCVEAGLSLERGLVKVAAEIHLKSVTLAQELQLVLMEMRSGFSKERALRNFALRLGVDDVDSLVAMLIQSERFGTSVGDALRVYSDNLREKRRVVAEETAAKIGLKLLFPLIFCIFPILLMVLLGPAAMQITRTFATAVGST
jgi:tight adherence protein C